MSGEQATFIARKYMGCVLRRSRDAAGLSQQQLADAVGISKGFYSSLESGKRVPNLDMLIRLAKPLHVSPGTLLDAAVAESKKL